MAPEMDAVLRLLRYTLDRVIGDPLESPHEGIAHIEAGLGALEGDIYAGLGNSKYARLNAIDIAARAIQYAVEFTGDKNA